jgi:hypothetical protein
MRNVDDNRAASGPGRRRTRVAVGAAGLAAILGTGAFVVTKMIDDAHHTAIGDAGALVPQPLGSAASRSTGVGSSAPGNPSAGTPTPTPTAAQTKSAAQRAADARAANAKAGPKVLRPLPPKSGGVRVAAEDLTVKTFGSVQKNRRTLRVMSARQDLSGQRELGWVADDGVPVGDARCSQNFRLSTGVPVTEKSSLLVCWRLSKKKSVYTVAVTIGARPSKAESVAAIDKAWSRL